MCLGVTGSQVHILSSRRQKRAVPFGGGAARFAESRFGVACSAMSDAVHSAARPDGTPLVTVRVP